MTSFETFELIENLEYCLILQLKLCRTIEERHQRIGYVLTVLKKLVDEKQISEDFFGKKLDKYKVLFFRGDTE